MLEQIDKIIKSNWSSSWFQKSSSQISPKFAGAQLTDNLFSMSDQVLKILLNNSNNNPTEESNSRHHQQRRSSSSSSSNKEERKTMVRLASLDRVKMHYLLVERGNMSERVFDKLMRANVSIDNDEMRSFLIEHLESQDMLGNGAGLSISRERRMTIMSQLFCSDSKRFGKIVHIENSDDGNFWIFYCFSC